MKNGAVYNLTCEGNKVEPFLGKEDARSLTTDKPRE